jgi:hypothetical protein
MKTASPPKVDRRPATRPGIAPSRLVLTIDRTAYVLVPLPRALDPAWRAYRLIKADGAVYDLSETRYGPSCDCPDFVFRRDGLDPAGCKHVRALVRHGLIADA